MIDFENWREVARAQHEHTTQDGYWNDTSIGEHLAHLHSEVSELFEAYRNNPDRLCDKGINITAEEEEMADIYLILLDLVHKRGINLAEAARKKFEFNKTRDIRKMNP